MASSIVLIDTGPLVALFSERDRDHEAVKQTFATLRLPLLTCLPVITEAAYHLRDRPDKVRQLLNACRGSHLVLLPIEGRHMAEVNTIFSKYEDQKFDFADACLMHLAEREESCQVLTLDERDFRVFRTVAGKSLSLVPIADM